MVKPYDPHGAIDVPDSRFAFVRDSLVRIHRQHAERSDFGTMRVERRCRLDTGEPYKVTRLYRPISIPETVDTIQWWLLLDKLGFDLPGKDFER